MNLRVLPFSLLTVICAACTVTTETTSDGGTDGGATSDAGTAGDGGTATGCDFGEPNNSRETAKVVELGTEYAAVCIGGTADPADFFEFTAPADNAGGYVQIQLRNVTGWTSIEAYAVSDNGKFLAHQGSDVGANVDGVFTVSPGAKYRVNVLPYQEADKVTKYDMKLVYTKVVDTYEPNNTRETAKAITKGTPIMASPAIVAVGEVPTPAEGDDWYSLDLAAGATTVALTNVPSDFWGGVELTNAAGVVVMQKPASDKGASVTMEVPATDVPAGAYRVRVYPYQEGGYRSAVGSTVSTRLSGQYTLTVTQ
ncbi:MAG: hypothetical protein U0169_04730 [Polyangiaceae bacterium]